MFLYFCPFTGNIGCFLRKGKINSHNTEGYKVNVCPVLSLTSTSDYLKSAQYFVHRMYIHILTNTLNLIYNRTFSVLGFFFKVISLSWTSILSSTNLPPLHSFNSYLIFYKMDVTVF